MKKFITRINGFCNSLLKEQQDNVSDAVIAHGWLDMGLYVYNSSSESEESLNSRFDGIIAGISRGDVVVFQLPTGNGHLWEQKLITKIKAYGGIVIPYVHELEFTSATFNDSISDILYTCRFQPTVIVNSFDARATLINEGLDKRKIFVRESDNSFFDLDYYTAKVVNLACEYALLGDECKYQLIQKDVERSGKDNRFTHYVATASYDGKTAISFNYIGDADEIVIKSGSKIIWKSDNLVAHYALVDVEENYRIFAMVYTQTGYLCIASTDIFAVSTPSYNEEKPKVSLIVPMYNSSDFIVRTIDSVLGQSLHDIELVLVDDESTDNTLEIVNWYCNKYENVKLIKKKNGGQGSARNAGIEFAHGQYITFMDHDDTLPVEAQKVLYELISTTNTDIAIGNTISMISENDGIVVHYTDKILDVVDAEDYMNSHSPVMIWNKIYKAELCKKIAFVPRHHEDISWSPIIFSYADTISLTSQIVYEWNRTSVTQSITNLERSEEWFAETYCIAVKDALERGNQERLQLVKKMILNCEAFNYHPGLYDKVLEIVNEY